MRYSGLTENEIKELLTHIAIRLTVVDEFNISKFSWKDAASLCEGIDVYDTPFVALNIELNAKLWTGDKKLITGLKNKGYSDVLDTSELSALIKTHYDNLSR